MISKENQLLTVESQNRNLYKYYNFTCTALTLSKYTWNVLNKSISMF